MDLRYRLAVVTGAGTGLGREVAVALGRVGAAVLAVDRDLVAAEETAARVRASRVSAWALQADLTEEPELQLVADRARDLGGMDLLVTGSNRLEAAPVMRLTQLFLAGLAERRGRRDGTPAVVNIELGAGPTVRPGQPSAPELARLAADLTDQAETAGARVMVVRCQPALPLAGSQVARMVVDLLRDGTAGQVVELGAT